MRITPFILSAVLAVLALLALGGCNGDTSQSPTPSPTSTSTPSSEPSPATSPELTPEPSPEPSPEVIAEPSPTPSEGSPSTPDCPVAGLLSDLDFGGERQFAPGEPISMTLSLTNCADSPVRLFYPDSQRYEFIVEDEEDEEVWRWSQDKSFAQALGEETIEPGEEVTYTEVWDQRAEDGEQVSPGTYQILGFSIGCADESASDCHFGPGLLIRIAP